MIYVHIQRKEGEINKKVQGECVGLFVFVCNCVVWFVIGCSGLCQSLPELLICI